jgi:hypothetical protein
VSPVQTMPCADFSFMEMVVTGRWDPMDILLVDEIQVHSA